MTKKTKITTYPLTAAQKLHYLSLQYAPKKQVINIGISLTIQLDINFDLLREAIEKAIERCESMRVRMTHNEEGEALQYIVPKDDTEIGFMDYSQWKIEDAHHQMDLWTEMALINDDQALYRIVMIKMPDGYNGMYLTVNHMIMDAQSIIIFMRDIVELYANKAYEDIPMPKDMSSYIEQLEKDLAYEAGSKASQRDREWFYQLIESSEPYYCDVNGKERLMAERERTGNPNLRAASYISTDPAANIRNFHLDPEPTNRLLKFCEDNQVPMTCLLLMGLRSYLQKVNESDDVTVLTTIARRATLSEKKSGGSRIHCFPFRTIVSPDDTFMEGIYKVRDMQNQYFRHANFSTGEYYYHRTNYWKLEPGQGYESLGLTYQPLNMKAAEDELSQVADIKYQVKRHNNGVTAHGLYLTVSHDPFDQGLDFCFEYQTGFVSEERLEEVYYYITRMLFHAVEDANRTVGEVIKWA